jgi:nitrate reductase NapE component
MNSLNPAETPQLTLMRIIFSLLSFQLAANFCVASINFFKTIPSSNITISFIGVSVGSYLYGYCEERLRSFFIEKQIKKLCFIISFFPIITASSYLIFYQALLSDKPFDISSYFITPIFLYLIMAQFFHFSITYTFLKMGIATAQKNSSTASSKRIRTAIKYFCFLITPLFILVAACSIGGYLYYRANFEQLLVKNGKSINTILAQRPLTKEDWEVYCSFVETKNTASKHVAEAYENVHDKRLLHLYNSVFYSGAPYADQCPILNK